MLVSEPDQGDSSLVFSTYSNQPKCAACKDELYYLFSIDRVPAWVWSVYYT